MQLSAKDEELFDRERHCAGRYRMMKEMGDAGADAFRDWIQAQREIVRFLLSRGVRQMKWKDFTFMVDRSPALHVYFEAG